ncbi:UBP1-associated protein 2A [Morella rubra]|uniref:UBP1-associated protein 2A n=1 Tax=Morella rubra TaxID=262757 RepID=A0A6A1W4T5_9ROSI|nr:UBP1-associated protein 2A [Morella rubra]
MAKKRKLRSSEPEPSKAPEPEPQEAPVQVEEQQIQSEPDPIPEEEEAPQEQQDNMAVDDSREEEPEQQLVEEEEEEEEEEERRRGGGGGRGGRGEGQEEHEGLNASNEPVPSEARSLAVNGTEEEGEGDRDEEPVENLLEPFSKEQLVALVKKAVDKHPDLIESVRELADADPAHRKIFVHGLGWDTTAETLTSVFGRYGAIEDCKAVTDRVSGKSKGYAFILFKHRSGAREALKQPQKQIGNRTTSCQLASSGPVPAPPPVTPPVSEYTQRKIFVSNVSADVDPNKLLDFFKQYGEIEDGPLGIDKQTGKPKGFALFVYKTVESARKALEEPHKNFEGHTLHCQKAIDGPKPSRPFHHQQQHHPHHHQSHYHSRKEKNKYSAGDGTGPGHGHLMAPSGPAVGFNPAVGFSPTQALNPVLGQALTTLLATQGAGLGLGNLLGGLGGGPVNQAGPPAGYGNQAGGSYGNQPVMQGVYQNPQMGQNSASRPHPGGGAPYMGH